MLLTTYAEYKQIINEIAEHEYYTGKTAPDYMYKHAHELEEKLNKQKININIDIDDDLPF